jgi:hypothetical protein
MERIRAAAPAARAVGRGVNGDEAAEEEQRSSKERELYDLFRGQAELDTVMLWGCLPF